VLDLLPTEPEPVAADRVYDSLGVDRSQIRQMLALSPTERLGELEVLLASILEIRVRTPRTSTR
jgi:hypothetical protein